MDQSGLDKAVQMLRAGEVDAARPLLVAHLKENLGSDRGWYFLSFAITDQARIIECLERALKINPRFDEARARLTRLTSTPESPPEPPVASETQVPMQEAAPQDIHPQEAFPDAPPPETTAVSPPPEVEEPVHEPEMESLPQTVAGLQEPLADQAPAPTPGLALPPQPPTATPEAQSIDRAEPADRPKRVRRKRRRRGNAMLIISVLVILLLLILVIAFIFIFIGIEGQPAAMIQATQAFVAALSTRTFRRHTPPGHPLEFRQGN